MFLEDFPRPDAQADEAYVVHTMDISATVDNDKAHVYLLLA